MQKVQKTYTKELKREALRLIQASGRPIAQLARELGISDRRILEWRKSRLQGAGAALATGTLIRSPNRFSGRAMREGVERASC